jgi:hypothetical protein
MMSWWGVVKERWKDREGEAYGVASGKRADVEECVGLFGLEDLHRRDLTYAMVSSNGVVTFGLGDVMYPG